MATESIQKVLRSVELFAGAGGLALGTARAGFQHDAVLEWDADACNTIRKNLAKGFAGCATWKVIEDDARVYDFAQHSGKVEYVFGGPPCQPFSLGGKHLGHEDERNMFPEAVRSVREIRPVAFVFENVRGLLRQGFANYYNYIIHQLRFPGVLRKGDEEWTDHLARLEKLHTGGKFKGLGYNVVYRLLDAADYGVPQHRDRVLIVGVRSDVGIEFHFPERTHEGDALLYDKWVSGDYWERHHIARSQRLRLPDSLKPKVERLSPLWPGAMLKPWQTVRDAISDLPRLIQGQSSSKIANHFLNPGARSYAGHTGSSLDDPAKALKAGDHGVPGGENTLKLENGDVRYFSVRECARLQTFPDNWVFEGSWTESMRQLGNAVPVTLAEVVARRLADLVVQRDSATGRQRNLVSDAVKRRLADTVTQCHP